MVFRRRNSQHFFSLVNREMSVGYVNSCAFLSRYIVLAQDPVILRRWWELLVVVLFRDVGDNYAPFRFVVMRINPNHRVFKPFVVVI